MSAGWLDDPALRRVWQVLRERLEARGLRAEGRVVLHGLNREERHAVAGLLGRSVVRERIGIDLAGLDADLEARSGIGGLVAVVEHATGAPLRDRPSDRARHAAQRDAPVELARTLLAGKPWLETWIQDIRRSGVLSRATDATAAVRTAAAALSRLPGRELSRTELAVAAGGHAHALDDGSTAAALVLRALAAQAGDPVPTTASGRRDLWELSGVRVDLVSTTCLALGLRGRTGPVAARLDLAADAGDPVHLTPWDLRRCVLRVPDTVLVCENPRVLEAVAERGARTPVVCTSGQPALVVLDVLAALRGADLRYHGDFDGAGVAIAHRLIASAGVTPWRMAAADYERGLAGATLPLVGAPVEPAWDPELGAAMRHHGLAVHEEAVLPHLLDGIT
ncbi:uncharacterized protein (TIGR02679 family) [Pseudonocardia hierapolitana]|uniref:Uncharacterized protein (TIGR02679 family) n=1 Tax=Pseudonocardia hierapolitana TaxID=1128676 RepID=A0A561SLA3_9PSEU|nr:TIGR02679 family protein [Pseudonocardia hierapolitana]TWF75658.1 uncharacterized protein (TIGR02679 family) [Pseudonocardia hierapolitana]